jgi:hypothetical protein
MNKIADIPLSMPMPEKSKRIGSECLQLSKSVIEKLDIADDHARMLQTAFEKFPNTEENKVWDSRKFLRDYRDQVLKNYNDFVLSSFTFLKKAEFFSSDLELQKIIDSFINSVGELKDLLEAFEKSFDNLKDNKFIENTTKLIGNILSQTSNIRDILDDRVGSYVNQNILNSNWYNDLKSKE